MTQGLTSASCAVITHSVSSASQVCVVSLKAVLPGRDGHPPCKPKEYIQDGIGTYNFCDSCSFVQDFSSTGELHATCSFEGPVTISSVFWILFKKELGPNNNKFFSQVKTLLLVASPSPPPFGAFCVPIDSCCYFSYRLDTPIVVLFFSRCL